MSSEKAVARKVQKAGGVAYATALRFVLEVRPKVPSGPHFMDRWETAALDALKRREPRGLVKP